MLGTLRGRIALVASLVVAGAFVLTGLAIVGVTARAEQDRLQRDLVDRLRQVEDIVRAGRPGGRPPEPGAVLGGALAEDLRDVAQRTLGPGYFLVVSRGSRVVATLGDLPESTPTAADLDTTRRFTDSAGTTYLVRTTEARGRGAPALTFTMGADLDRFVGRQQRALTNRFVVIGALATLLAGLVTFLVAGVAARPLRRLREATEAVAATEDLTTRVDVAQAPSEVAAVADGLNTMLARLQRSREARESALHAARRFAADAGHELRTPLTAMRSTLESLVRNPSTDEALRAEMLGEVAEETRRLAGLLEGLQALARADAGLGGAAEVVDVGDVVGAAVDAAAGRHPRATITAELGSTPALVSGSATWLRSIVDNLLRNAAVHGRDGGRVVAEVVTSPPGWVTLTVDDDGSGIPPEERQRVFERFIRGADATSRPGSGLGLSLVAQLVALHGGAVRVADSPLGGARLEVRLPAIGAPPAAQQRRAPQQAPTAPPP